MAFIPDSAIESMSEVSGSAFRLYAYLCMRRNRRSGICFPSLRLTSEETGIAYGHASVCRAELAEKGWIVLEKGGKIRPLKGFENESEEQSEVFENRKKSFENRKHISENRKKSFENRKPDDEKVFENRKNVFENRKPHNKDILTREVTNEVTNDIERVCDLQTVAEIRNRSQKGSRIPEPFILTAEMRSWVAENHPDVDAVSETQSFVDYFRGVSGKQGIKLDWLATWRNWIRRSKQFNGTKSKGRKSATETIEDYNQWFESLG